LGISSVGSIHPCTNEETRDYAANPLFEVVRTADAKTSNGPVDFGAAWPSARARLAALLRARGLQPADIDDVTQDVAMRALRSPRRFDSEEHLCAWCCRVAINLHIDSTRRRRRMSTQAPPEVAAGVDTAATVERRLALEVLAERIADLSDEERRLLLEPESTDSRREAVKLAVRRHRLRARLATLVEGMIAAVVAVKRFWRSSRPLSTTTKVALAAMPVVFAGLMLVPFTTNAPDNAPTDTEPTVQVPRLTAVPTSDLNGGGRAAGQPGSRSQPSPWRPVPPAPAVRAPTRTGIASAAPAGVPVGVAREDRPSGQPLFCGDGLITFCIARPPGVPEPTLPPTP
jgi:hypothetical protein